MVSPVKILSMIENSNDVTIYLHLDLIIYMLSLAGITYTIPIFLRFMRYRIYYPLINSLK